jgi:hypothetical protein
MNRRFYHTCVVPFPDNPSIEEEYRGKEVRIAAVRLKGGLGLARVSDSSLLPPGAYQYAKEVYPLGL